MTRSVRAVVIGLPDAEGASFDIRADHIAAQFADFLRCRPYSPDKEIWLSNQRETTSRSSVIGSILRLAPSENDLVVIAFFGHGIKRDNKTPYEGWALSDGELTDYDLATLLNGMRETNGNPFQCVIVSGCCYGLGLLRAGNRSTPTTWARRTSGRSATTLDALERSSAFIRSLRMHMNNASLVDHLIGVAAADIDRGVSHHYINNFSTYIQCIAERPDTYVALRHLFEQEGRPGGRFIVQASAGDLKLNVLAV